MFDDGWGGGGDFILGHIVNVCVRAWKEFEIKWKNNARIKTITKNNTASNVNDEWMSE